MNSSDFMKCIVDELENLTHSQCLCSSSDRSLRDLFISILSSPSANLGVECELLFMNVVHQSAEIYSKRTEQTLNVCEEMSNFVEMFRDDDLWSTVVDYFKRQQDKYLLYIVTKALAAVMYTFPENLFKLRVEFLIANMVENKNSCEHELEILIKLVDYKHDTITENDVCKCKRTTSCVITPSEDLFTILCSKLSQNWDAVLDIFLRAENQNISLFLNLWKLLSVKDIKEQFSLTFLKAEHAVEFLTLSFQIPSESVRIYVDIISQIFLSNFKASSLNHTGEHKFEGIVITALSKGFLGLLHKGNKTSTFCNSVSRDSSSLNEGNTIFNVTSKKVIFIILSLLAEFKNVQLLCDALQKVFDCLAFSSSHWKPQTIYLSIADTFIEEDDLIFGVMLSSLRIYCTLKKEMDSKSEAERLAINKFKSGMNPHKIFVTFLQQIGNDHNELLSFLLSDETCCLLYLLQYLKLLLLECESFIQAHEIFLKTEDISSFSSTYMPESVMNTSDVSLPVKLSDKVHNQKLVSYSYSSSSDEESSNIAENGIIHESECLRTFASKTVSVLTNLKAGIQRLVDQEEFPYNISPLLCLLKACEEKFRNL